GARDEPFLALRSACYSRANGSGARDVERAGRRVRRRASGERYVRMSPVPAHRRTPPLLARRAPLAAAALAAASGGSRASAEPAPVAASAAPVPPRFRGAAMGGGSPRAPDRDGANAERRLPAEERTFVFEDTPVGRMVVVVLVPERAPGERFPLLIPFHGLGEIGRAH